jgi:hypothetical protein
MCVEHVVRSVEACLPLRILLLAQLILRINNL